jgi:hypothetical protein
MPPQLKKLVDSILVVTDYKIQMYVFGVSYIDIITAPNFVKTGKLVQRLKW